LLQSAQAPVSAQATVALRERHLKNMSKQIKLGIGSALSTFGALGITLSLIFEWTAAPQPWGFLLGFAFGVSAGLGATLVMSGLMEQRCGS
jgi:hypothetical protein